MRGCLCGATYGGLRRGRAAAIAGSHRAGDRNESGAYNRRSIRYWLVPNLRRRIAAPPRPIFPDAVRGEWRCRHLGRRGNFALRDKSDVAEPHRFGLQTCVDHQIDGDAHSIANGLAGNGAAMAAHTPLMLTDRAKAARPQPNSAETGPRNSGNVPMWNGTTLTIMPMAQAAAVFNAWREYSWCDTTFTSGKRMEMVHRSAAGRRVRQ